jgi:hypothetical protein
VERTWKPKTAGILCIIVGALFVIPSIVFLRPSNPTVLFTAPTYLVLPAIVAAPGIMPIVGGIYALRRRRWGLALAGSILALLSSVILGIYGVVVLLGASVDNPGVELSDLTTLVIGIIVTVVLSGIFGLLALILVIRGRREFG